MVARAYLVYDYYTVTTTTKARRSKWPLGVHSRVASEAFLLLLPVVVVWKDVCRGCGVTLLPLYGWRPYLVKTVAEVEKNSFFIALLPFCRQVKQEATEAGEAMMAHS